MGVLQSTQLSAKKLTQEGFTCFLQTKKSCLTLQKGVCSESPPAHKGMGAGVGARPGGGDDCMTLLTAAQRGCFSLPVLVGTASGWRPGGTGRALLALVMLVP